YGGLLGAASVLRPAAPAFGAGGGKVGTFLAEGPSHWITPVGAFILLVAMGIAGLLIAFNLRLSQLTRPMTAIARWLGSSAAVSMRRTPDSTETGRGNGRAGAPPEGGSIRSGGRPRGPRVAGGPTEGLPGQAG